MKTFKQFLIIAGILLSCNTLIAQETTLQLPTNDNTSSFNVKKNNGTNVLKVDGSGRITGDGSGLSNVKSLASSIGGNQMFQITKNYGWYENVRTVTLSAPSSGICFAMASGYARWESQGWDLLLAGILCDKDPNSDWNAENEWYKYLNILTDYNCVDSSDQYTSFAQHRCISVNAGTHTFTLWANKYSSSAKVRVDDVNLSVIFIPTGGTGSANASISSTMLTGEEAYPYSREDLENKKIALQNTLDGTINGRAPGISLEDEKKGIDSRERIRALENEVAELNRRLNLLLEKIE